MANVIEIEDYDVSLSNISIDTNPERNTSASLSYNEFFLRFLVANRPCVIRSDVTKNWRCRREWSVEGAPNFKILEELFGNCEAPVADCKKKYYNSQLKNNMTIKNYLNYWTKYKDKNYPEDMPILYLKDWHCMKKYQDLGLYEVPKYFASDWLNEFYIAHPELEDDYMFVYMGPKGTWTPFHADVFTSYSWSANIVGKKRWLLFPPGEENSLRDSHGQLSFDVTSEDLKDPAKYPNYNEKTLKCFEIIQEEGEIIFVPSGWHHQVWNLADTISINHNWINACNISNWWLALKNELSDVMKEVEDCRDMDDWEKHCQLMLKASHGMNYLQFYEFLVFIIERRLNALRDLEDLWSFHNWKLGAQHCLFDLKQANIVLSSMIEDTKQKQIYQLVFPNDKVHDLIDDINELFALRNSIKDT